MGVQVCKEGDPYAGPYLLDLPEVEPRPPEAVVRGGAGAAG